MDLAHCPDCLKINLVDPPETGARQSKVQIFSMTAVSDPRRCNRYQWSVPFSVNHDSSDSHSFGFAALYSRTFITRSDERESASRVPSKTEVMNWNIDYLSCFEAFAASRKSRMCKKHTSSNKMCQLFTKSFRRERALMIQIFLYRSRIRSGDLLIDLPTELQAGYDP